MTDNEIIKALEKAANADCNRCSFNNENCDGEDCDKYIAQKILDLINRQQAEIEAQCKAVKYYQSKATEIKAEAIKEFAERLITEQSFYDGQETRIYLTEKDLDNLVKEMVGDTE